MVIDGNALTPGDVLGAQYCVMGSGMGGASVAQRLAAAGKDVLIVEAGSLEPGLADGRQAVSVEYVGRPFNMPPTRCIELGGTSNQWHGICAPLDDIDFAERPWVPGSGWPITLRDLRPYYEAAAELHGVPSAGLFEIEKLREPLRERLRDIRFNDAQLERKLYYYRKPPTRWKAPLLHLARSGRLRCVLNAPALELVSAENGTSIERLVLGARERTATVRADVFVVCCGALETPRLLLNSSRGAVRGLGNDYDLVGRNLLDHPTGHFSKIRFHKPTAAPLFAALPHDAKVSMTLAVVHSAKSQQANEIANHYLWIRPSVSAKRTDDELLFSFLAARGARDLRWRQIKAIVADPDIRYRVLVHRFGLHPKYRYGDLYFMTEQLPNPESRVRLSTGIRDRHGYPVSSVNWQLSDADLDGFHRYAKLLFESGLLSEQYELARIDDPEVWSRFVASAAHHLGTARMGRDPRTGVVDRDLKVFGFSNLFVCDASVFPTAGAANPSLTITALALRLGEHLLKQASTAVHR